METNDKHNGKRVVSEKTAASANAVPRVEKTLQIKKQKCVHEGHRKRLTEVAMQAGLYNMSEVQVMETFLTYIFPRGDVNPLAHAILDKFETFTQAVDAEPEDLKSICGIGDRAAALIHLFGDFARYYYACRTSTKFKIASSKDLLDVVEDNLRLCTSENLLLLAISAGGILTHKRFLSKNLSIEVGINSNEITNFISSTKLTGFAIAHCHPFGMCYPSPADWDAFERVKDICRACGVNFIDSLIVGMDGIYSQASNKISRQFDAISEF